ncbi:MAG: serine hydrolase domain-containing protein, partial [Anaerolineae bacterium]
PWDAPLDPTIDPLEQAVRSLSDEQLISAPGEAWNYSGWGYSMLGAIIVKVIGEPFESYMHQRWLEPLGMANSTFVMDEVDPDLYVTRYISAEDGSAAAMEHFVDPRDVPAAGLWSSCDDMTRWARFMLNKGELNGRRLLQPESINAMWTSVASTPWMDALGPWYGPYVGEYGLGWYVGEKAGHRLAGHAGAGDGVNTHIQFAPDDGLAVIAMDNWLKPDPEWYPAGFAAFDVMDLLLGIKPE